MGLFEFILFVIVISILGDSYKRHQKSKMMQSKFDGQSTNNDDRFQKLEDRIRVLENIIADRSTNLKDKFKELED